MKVFQSNRQTRKIKVFLSRISTVKLKEAVKLVFQEDFGEKDVKLMVNGLAKRLTPELQSTLVLSLIEYRNTEIKETEDKLNTLKQDRDKLLAAIITANNQSSIL